jgi:pSer/pThr/pTyr-binding forkhead associated (FHA) protein
VSRHHFDLRVLNERLVLHARSGKGALINDREVPTGAVVPIEDGDVIAPSRDVAGAVAVRACFEAGQHGRVSRIELRREPAARG